MKLKHSKAVSKEFFIPSFYLMLVRVAAVHPRLFDFFWQASFCNIQTKLIHNKVPNNLNTSFKVVAIFLFKNCQQAARKISTKHFFLGKNHEEKN